MEKNSSITNITWESTGCIKQKYVFIIQNCEGLFYGRGIALFPLKPKGWTGKFVRDRVCCANIKLSNSQVHWMEKGFPQ